MNIRHSLDEVERLSFNPGSIPFSGKSIGVRMERITPQVSSESGFARKYVLDDQWFIAEHSEETNGPAGEWWPAVVPGSVHTALMNAGIIPDPYVGKNDSIARAQSFRTWWIKKEFEIPADFAAMRIVFNGVCDSCTVWFNGHQIADNQGMFTSFEFDLTDKVLRKGRSTLLVRLESAPYRISTGEPNPYWIGMNVGWMDTVIFNNVYGWHYIDVPATGIWRTVVLEEKPHVEIKNPFIATKDYMTGTMNLSAELEGGVHEREGTLRIEIEPDNFEGNSFGIEYEVRPSENEPELHFEFQIPEHRLWWPNGLGDPHLYRMTLNFMPKKGIGDRKQVIFGIRKVQFGPLPGGPDPEIYNWALQVSGRALFAKGTNWCTIDALMRFDKRRYARFMDMARRSHIQLMRAWGAGLPETDEFYDLANRMGIMIYQEWPTAWDSHKVQPLPILEKTVRQNMMRLRNHPSLIQWGGGNESPDPTGVAIDMMGRLSYELDGTRAFRRTQPWGGSLNNYDVYWGRQSLDRNLQLESPFLGEFGLASAPNLESVKKYIPRHEWGAWPPPPFGTFAHKTPVFNRNEDMSRLSHYVTDFIDNSSMAAFVLGTQLAQTTGLRHTLELARTRWPEAAGVAFYKLNDNCPSVSWSIVDWYGAPKLAYYFVQDAYSPLAAVVLLDGLNPGDSPMEAPVFILDDSSCLAGRNWEVEVTAFGSTLREVKKTSFRGRGAIHVRRQVGQFSLTKEQMNHTPLFIVSELRLEGALRYRSFYWLNYLADQGCLFRLPRTTLQSERHPGKITIRNTSSLPAVGVNMSSPHSDELTIEDNFFWMNPGETREVDISGDRDVSLQAWNVD